VSPPFAPVIVRKGVTTSKRVAFSFDAGSDGGHTTEILDRPAAEHLRVSFGLTGDFATKFPDLVRRMAKEGHHFINHSQSPPSFTGFSTSAKPLTATQRQAQLAEADDVISALTGATTKPWFRPPYGDLDNGVALDVAAAGYPMIAMWTVDSLGWKSTPASQVVQRCLSRVEPGAVYLFHVGSASTDADALADIIAGIRSAGYEIVSVADIMN
jgi:peptidoglycan-N-acetylglucosamine deacetylase